MAQVEPNGQVKVGAHWVAAKGGLLWEEVRKGLTEASASSPVPNLEHYIEHTEGENTLGLQHEPFAPVEGTTSFSIVAHVYAKTSAAENGLEFNVAYGPLGETASTRKIVKAITAKWYKSEELTGVPVYIGQNGEWGVSLHGNTKSVPQIVYACYLEVKAVIGPVTTRPIFLAPQAVRRGSVI